MNALQGVNYSIHDTELTTQQHVDMETSHDVIQDNWVDTSTSRRVNERSHHSSHLISAHDLIFIRPVRLSSDELCERPQTVKDGLLKA